MVACKTCVYYRACMAKRKQNRIENLISEIVNCGRYVRKVMKNHKALDR